MTGGGIAKISILSSPASAIAFASPQNNTALPSANLSNTSQSKHSARADTYQGQGLEEDDDQENNISSFLPWGKSPLQFGIDVFLSALTYAATYWFINRFSILHMKNFNNKIRDNLPTEEKKAEFDIVLKKLLKYDPLNSNKYWKEFYEPTLLKGGSAHESLSSKDKSFAKLYSVIYAAPRRYVFAGIVSVLSVGRAYATNPGMPLWMGITLFLFPLFTNILFGTADSKYRDAAKSAMKAGVTGEALEATAKMASRNWMDISEIFNFAGKTAMKSIKRAENMVTFVVALISSLISRVSRDVMEDGLPERQTQPHKENRNPFMRWVSRLPFVEDLRKMEKNENGPLRKGFLQGNKEENSSYSKIMLRGVAAKVGLKYLTDFVVFGLIGMGMLKIVYFFQNLFAPGGKPNELVYTDTQIIDDLIATSLTETYKVQNNIVSFTRSPDGNNYLNKGLTAIQST